MANKMYVKEDMNFEGISMQEGKSSSTLKLLVFMIITAIVLGLLIFTAGNYFASTNKQSNTPQITILPTSAKIEPTMSPNPSPNPSPTGKTQAFSPSPHLTTKPSVTTNQKVTVIPTSVKKTSLTIEILNGSGVKGAAGKMSTALTDAGYTITSTGNADSFDYTGVSVEIKKSKSKSLDQLKKDLSASGYITSKTSTTLDESTSSDAVIILGTE